MSTIQILFESSIMCLLRMTNKPDLPSLYSNHIHYCYYSKKISSISTQHQQFISILFMNVLIIHAIYYLSHYQNGNSVAIQIVTFYLLRYMINKKSITVKALNQEVCPTFFVRTP